MLASIAMLSLFAIGCAHSPYYKVDKDGYITASKWKDRMLPVNTNFPPSAISVEVPDYGKVLGGTIENAEFFLGMPYAKSPLGSLRFMPAQDIGQLTGTLNASEFCPSVVGASDVRQMRTTTIPNDAKVRADEDALCLNLWRPKGTAASANLPIMVFIYGGGFVSGSSTNAWYDGKNLAQNYGRVMATFNYRVGPLGFFSSPDLLSETSGNGGANGLMDQVKALKWIQSNAPAFGGDAGNVGLFGESAGALSVCSHVVSPQSAGLFKRAILESGACNGPWSVGEKTDGLAISSLLMSNFNCTDVACLRSLPSSELAYWPFSFEYNQSLQTSWKLNPYDWQFPGYWVDEFFLPAQQYELYNTGTINAEAMMVVENSMDGFLSFLYPYVYDQPTNCSGSTYKDAQHYHWQYEDSTKYPKIAAQVEELYACPVDAENQSGTPVGKGLWQFAASDRDYALHCSSVVLADVLTKRGVPVYRGTFSVGPRRYDQACIDGMIPCCQDAQSCYGWASHGAEIPFVFNTTENACDSESICGQFVDPFTGDEPAIVQYMQDSWASFLATGTPVSSAGPTWPEASKGMANFTNPAVKIEPSEISPRLSTICQYWTQYYPGGAGPTSLVV